MVKGGAALTLFLVKASLAAADGEYRGVRCHPAYYGTKSETRRCHLYQRK